MCKEGECLECMTIDRNQLSDYLDKIARFLIDGGSVKTDDMMQEEIPVYVVESVTTIRSDLDAAKARAKTAEENWHKNEARIIRLRTVADSMAEILEYDAGDAEHNMQDFAKELLADYEYVKGDVWG